MTSLNCNVTTCQHNRSNLCCKDGIKVTGENATTSEITNCQSFDEKDASFLSSEEQPKYSMQVLCEAERCVYNELGVCGAEAISIAGGPVSSASKTECGSFVPKY